MTSPPQFRRVILGLGSGQVDEALLAPSAEFANLLGASIQGVFVEDETLTELADFFRIREFDSLSHEWRPLDAARTADEVQLMMRSAKRRLERVASQWKVEGLFEVVRSGSLQDFLRVAHPSDILVVSASESPQERLAQPTSRIATLSEEKLTALLLPRRIARHHGPVIAMASPAGDAALRVAAAIAQTTAERLVLVVPATAEDHVFVAHAAHAAGICLEKIDLLKLSRTETQNFLAVVEQVRERMIVLPRLTGVGGERVDPSLVSTTRSTPVMIVDPEAAFD